MFSAAFGTLLAMSIVPDTKDWTWVLESVCPECTFDVRTIRKTEIGNLIRENALAWNAELANGGAALAVRPSPDRWSTQEYAGHVRAVFRLYLYRLNLMLAEDGPHYPDWNQDATADEEDYNAQNVATISREITEAAEALADRFDEASGNDWERTGYRSDGAAFTVTSFARYLVHDPVHHLWDVQR